MGSKSTSWLMRPGNFLMSSQSCCLDCWVVKNCSAPEFICVTVICHSLVQIEMIFDVNSAVVAGGNDDVGSKATATSAAVAVVVGAVIDIMVVSFH